MDVVRRAGTLDPVLAELRAELRRRLPARPAMPPRDIDRRKQVRLGIERSASLRVGTLRLPAVVLDAGAGGLFLSTRILVEEGEQGTVHIDDDDSDAVPVRVMWTRGAGHPMGMGMGVSFVTASARQERRALELVLRLLDEVDDGYVVGQRA